MGSDQPLEASSSTSGSPQVASYRDRCTFKWASKRANRIYKKGKIFLTDVELTNQVEGRRQQNNPRRQPMDRHDPHLSLHQSCARRRGGRRWSNY